jgi:hypothetical protein
MMTPGGRSSFCARAATSMPLSFGIATSRISVSGWYSEQSRSASRPSAASATTVTVESVSSRLLSPRRTIA